MKTKIIKNENNKWQIFLINFFNFFLIKLSKSKIYLNSIVCFTIITPSIASDSVITDYIYIQVVPSYYFFTLVTSIYIIGLFSLLLSSRNFLLFLLKVELMLISINLGFIGVATYSLELDGYAFSLLLLGLLAAETVIGLSLFIFVFFMKKDDVMKEIIMFEFDLLKTDEERSAEERVAEFSTMSYSMRDWECENSVAVAEVYEELQKKGKKGGKWESYYY